MFRRLLELLARAPAILVAVVFVAAGSAGCMSSRVLDSKADRMFRDGDYSGAANRFREGLEDEGNGVDRLLWMLDLGLALHTAGDYKESNKVFIEADKVAEIKDYTSLAEEGATLLTGENAKDYKGEDFEKVLINTYLAMNFAALGDREDALVEAKRVNRKLELMVSEGKRNYKQNAFARYLSAMLYEAESEYGDAYIDYKRVRELEPGFPGLGRDLWRMCLITRRPDEAKKWEREYGLSDLDRSEARKLLPRSNWGEIVILYQNGISPVKRPNPHFNRVPKFFARYNPVSQAKVHIDRRHAADTAVLHDVQSTAIANLDEKYAGLIAKRLAGVVVKEVVAHQVEKHTNNQALGFLARVLLHASDQADLRSWNLLPRDLQVARIPVEPGTHEVYLEPVGAGKPLAARTVLVEPGRKVFIPFRYIP